MANGLRTSDYAFELPTELIAQLPVAERDQSRLMVVERSSGRVEHAMFRDLIGLIPAGDALVLNTTRVIRARLVGRRLSGGAGEVLLLRPIGMPEEKTFEAMVHPGGKLRPGRRLYVTPDLSVDILSITQRRTRTVRLITPLPADEAIHRFGHIPLPPYINRQDEANDSERYQTVYAETQGSVAAPTAGLHFTTDLLGRLDAKGVQRANVVLHVGAGTFKPVEVEDPTQHPMHEEWFSLPAGAAGQLNHVRAKGGKIWAVGTTSARTLESTVRPDGTFVPAEGETDLFIRPGYTFRAVDRLITNFHLPRSTLLMLVAAFAGYELTMRAYALAIEQRYRFYSYGDAMVIL